jgi:hypothetical protein
MRSDPTFRFLDLPAELRNIIYFICRDAAATRLTCPRGRSYLARPKAPYLHLAHVNHQIRCEFLPICFQHIEVRLRDVAAYVHHFLQRGNITSGKVKIDVSEHKGECDVYPLLRMCKNNSALKIQVTSVQPDHRTPMCSSLDPRPWSTPDTFVATIEAMFQQLIAQPETEAQQRWSRYFDDIIERIYVCQNWRLHVTIRAKEDYASGDGPGEHDVEDWKTRTGWPIQAGWCNIRINS